MAKVGVAIEHWKAEIFERRLSESGYRVRKGPGVTSDTLMLFVVTDNVEALQVVLAGAMDEARRTGEPGNR